MGLGSLVGAIIGVVAAPFTGGASLALTAAALVAPKVVDKVFDFVLKPFLGNMGVPDQGAQETSFQQGVTTQKLGGSVNSIPVVYGFRKVGSIVPFAETGSDNNKYLWVAHVLCEGQIAGVKSIILDDINLPEADIVKLNAGDVVDISGGKYKDRVRMQLFKGAYYTDPTSLAHPTRQFCFFNTDAVRPPSWNIDMVYNGLAVVFARYEWKKITTQEEADANPFGGNVPQLQAEVYGKLLSAVPSSAPVNEYDTDSVRYQTLTTSAGVVIGYTNPVEVLLDYMRNPRYGKGLKNADIDWPSWNIAAQKCATEVTYASGIKGPILSCNYVLDTSASIFNNTKTLLENFRGYMPYVNGKYKLKIEDAGNSTDILSGSADVVMTFTKDDIVGDLVYTGIERASKYNQVVVTWIDPDNKWSPQEVVYPQTETERQQYIAQDGNRENKGTFTAGAITNPIMAADLARIIFWKSRLSDSLSVTVNSKGLDLEPGDCIHITGNVLNFTTTYPWRVISMQLNNDMTVTLGCIYNPDYIYPYTRWGEPDKIYPVYIPKGAERYYPLITPSEKNGLLPPYPGKPSTTTGGTSALTDVIIISKISFIALDPNDINSSNNVYVDITYTQPPNTLYAGVDLFWKTDSPTDESWQTAGSNIVPGVGETIVTRFGPVVLNKQYVLNSRVRYQSGEFSNRVGVYNFKPTAASITPPPVDPGVPLLPVPVGGGGTGVNLADNFFKSVTATTMVDGTAKPLTPYRKIQVTVVQDMVAGSNSYLNGIEIYWKPTLNPKWNFVRQPVSQPQGSSVVFEIPVGPRLYPLRPGYAGEAPGAADDYDFIFRWSYSDGKAAVYQWHATNVSIEYNPVTSGYLFNPFTLTGYGLNIVAKELSNNYVPQIAGPADIQETREMVIGTPQFVNENRAAASPEFCRFWFPGPIAGDRANWVGVRVYRHKAGEAGTGDYQDFSPASYSTQEGLFYVSVPIQYDYIYEYVLVPLVNYGGSTEEAFKGQYCRGYVHRRTADADYPSDANWARKFTFDNLETLSAAKAKIGTAIALPPPKTSRIGRNTSDTVLASGLPSPARKIAFTFSQLTGGAINGTIDKLVIYYKQADATYWKKSTYSISLPYDELNGTTQTFDSSQTTPAMDLGYRTYPTFAGREQYYDFIVRFGYSDGTESLIESHFLNKPIEVTGTGTTPVYAFSPLGNNTVPGTTPFRDATVIATEDQAPPGSVLDPRDILSSTSMSPVKLYSFESPDNIANPNTMVFRFTMPVVALKSNLAGIRIYRREVLSGQNPPFTTSDVNIPYKYRSEGAAPVTEYVEAYDKVTWQKEYEWVLVPVVWYQGAKVEAKKAVYWRGKVTDSFNTNANCIWVQDFFSKKAPEVLDVAVAKDRLAGAFSDFEPTVKLESIKRVNPNYINSEALGYWQITYQVPSDFVQATIYRRTVNNPAAGGTGYYSTVDFAGAGRWERIVVNNTNNPVTTSGGIKRQTVNLRPALSNYFNDRGSTLGSYNLTTVQTTSPSINKAANTFMYYGSKTTMPGGADPNYLYHTLLGDTANGRIPQNDPITKLTQIFIVITTSSVPSVIRGILIDLQFSGPNSSGTVVKDNFLQDITKAQSVLFSDLNTSGDITKCTAAIGKNASWTTLYRRLDEYIASPDNAYIVFPGTGSTYSGPSYSPGTPGSGGAII